jgi:hypothetical protein
MLACQGKVGKIFGMAKDGEVCGMRGKLARDVFVQAVVPGGGKAMMG